MSELITLRELSRKPHNEQYHAHYPTAISSTQVAQAENIGVNAPLDWRVPSIKFSTDTDTRLSMTLNGMRMTTEFFAHDSQRILAFIEQRLQAEQRDVVHDVLVYLWERVLLIRFNAMEAKDLQAQSLAAYLGLEPQRIRPLLDEKPLLSSTIAQKIQSGNLGQVQRKLNVFLITENLLARLQPELNQFEDNEKRVLHLINEVTSRLYHSTSHKK